MAIRSSKPVFFAFALAVLAGCTTASTTTPNVTPVTSTTNIVAADSEPTAPSGTVWDLAQVTTSRTGGTTYTTLAVTMTFLQANAFASLLPPGASLSSGTGTTLIPVLGLDSDNNPATGTTSALCNGNTYAGIDFAVDGTNRLADGNFPIVKTGTLAKTGEAVVTGSGASVTFTIPLSALSSASGGGLAAIPANAFGGAGNITDCAPDSSTLIAY